MKILAFDIGTSSVRAAVYNPHSDFISRQIGQAKVTVRRPEPGTAFVDPAELKHLVGQFYHKPGSSYLPAGEDVHICVSGFWHSLLGLDAAGEPVTPCWIWEDAQATAEARALNETPAGQALPRLTGAPVAPTFWPARLRHLGRLPEVRRWVSLPEWVLGYEGTSLSMASGTGLLDRRTLDWSAEALEVAGIGREMLPAVSRKVQFYDRNQSRCYMVPTLGDGAAGTLGSGVKPGGNTLALNFGTSAAVRRMGSEPVAELPRGLFEYRLDEARTILGGAVNNAGNLFVWACENLRVPTEPVALEKALAARPEPVEGLVVLPFWAGERTPFWRGDLTGNVLGLNFSTAALDILQAIQEATFYRLREIADALDPQGVCEVVASGGLAGSPCAVQRLANILARPIAVLEEPEVSLFGAVLFAAEYAGFPPRESRRGRVYVPEPELVKRYGEARALHAVAVGRYIQGIGNETV
jgi:gluconokinase